MAQGIDTDFFIPIELRNCIFWGNRNFTSPTLSAQILVEGLPVYTATHTCIEMLPLSQSPDPVTGNINQDPLFVNAAANDLYLQASSPAIDRGNNDCPAGVQIPLDWADLDNDSSTTDCTPIDVRYHARIIGTTVDMGSIEFVGSCPADLNGSCRIDAIDLGILLASWSIPASAPGCGDHPPCPADINGDGFVNSLDLGILLAAWTLPAGGTDCDPLCGGSGGMMMGGGDESSLAGLGQPTMDPPILNPELLMWLMVADIQDLWTWYLEVTGGPALSEE